MPWRGALKAKVLRGRMEKRPRNHKAPGERRRLIQGYLGESTGLWSAHGYFLPTAVQNKLLQPFYIFESLISMREGLTKRQTLFPFIT